MRSSGLLERSLLGLLGVLWLLAGCAQSELPATQLLISVQASPDLAERLARLRVDVYDQGGGGQSGHDFSLAHAQTAPSMAAVTLPFSFGIGRGKASRITIVVSGFDAAEQQRVERKVQATFVERQTRALEIFLGSACLDEVCTSLAETCYPTRDADIGAGSCGPVPSPETTAVRPGAEPVLVGPISTDAAELDAGADAGPDAAPNTDASLDAGPDVSVDGEAGGAAPDGPDAALTFVDYALANAGDPCTNVASGTPACAGHASRTPLRCDDGRWLAQSACAETQRCDSRPGTAQGSCVPVIAACSNQQPGPVCDGLVRMECGVDLVSVRPLPCAENAHCASSPSVSCACDKGHYDNGNGVCTNTSDCRAGLCTDGTCVDGFDDYSCDCPSGFTGTGTKSCSPVKYCPKDACAPGGSCVDVADWRCNCSAGFKGTGTKACTNTDDCAASACVAPNGVCSDGVESYSCSCNTGFSGPDCINDICSPNPCLNNGVCTRTSTGASCSCAPGFSGQSCQVDACNPNPCLNGGTCARNATGPASCSCRPGFEGPSCATNTDNCPGNTCQHGSRCVDGVNTYSCDCDGTGFGGASCMTDVNECSGATVCAGASAEGVAFSYQCVNQAPFYRCRGQFLDWNFGSVTNRYSVGNGVVKDNKTGLEWQSPMPATFAGCSGKLQVQNDSCLPADAKAYCSGLTFAGGGWRLPSRAELYTLVDPTRTPMVDTSAFPQIGTGIYTQLWSSTRFAGGAPGSFFGDYVWQVTPSTGDSAFHEPIQTKPALCVR